MTIKTKYASITLYHKAGNHYPLKSLNSIGEITIQAPLKCSNALYQSSLYIILFITELKIFSIVTISKFSQFALHNTRVAKDNLQYIAGSITDEELVARLIKRDQQAAGILYDKFSPMLYGVLFRIVHSEETAEDLSQEVFVKIWNNISSYDSSKGKLVTWIVNIARNMGIDKIRSKDYKDSIRNSDIENYVNILDDASQSGFNPDFIGVKEMLNILKPEQRQIVDMVYFQGYKQNEAADYLKIPLGTLKTRLRTAISALREHFNK